MPGPNGADLYAQFARIDERLTILIRQFDREQEDHEEFRRSLTETIAALSEAVRALTKELSDMKPIVLDYRETRDSAKGMVAATRWFGGLMLGAGSLVGWLLGKAIENYHG